MNTVSSSKALALSYPLIGNQKVFLRFSDSLSIVNGESFPMAEIKTVMLLIATPEK